MAGLGLGLKVTGEEHVGAMLMYHCPQTRQHFGSLTLEALSDNGTELVGNLRGTRVGVDTIGVMDTYAKVVVGGFHAWR